MSVRGIPTDILLRGAKKWNTLFNFSLRSCKRMLWYSSRKEKGILTLNSGCWHWNQMETEMKLQPDTNSKKISLIVPDLQTSFSNYNCTWTYWSFKPPIRTAKRSATERLDGNFSVETSDFDGTLIKQQNRNHISRVSFQITKRTNRNRTQNLLTFEK